MIYDGGKKLGAMPKRGIPFFWNFDLFLVEYESHNIVEQKTYGW